MARADPKPGLIDVVCGRCIVDGQRAAQKMCWVPLLDVDTPEAYDDAVANGPPPPPCCPACRGPASIHGSFLRHLAQGPGKVVPIRLYRARCTRPDCPVVTFTLYPPFVLPYRQVPAPSRDACVRARHQDHVSWGHLAERFGYHPRTIRRWERRIMGRAGELKAAFFVLIDRLAPAYKPPAPTDALTLWDINDHCTSALRAPPTLGLATARTVLELFAPALPVWT